MLSIVSCEWNAVQHIYVCTRNSHVNIIDTLACDKNRLHYIKNTGDVIFYHRFE